MVPVTRKRRNCNASEDTTHRALTKNTAIDLRSHGHATIPSTVGSVGLDRCENEEDYVFSRVVQNLKLSGSDGVGKNIYIFLKCPESVKNCGDLFENIFYCSLQWTL